MWRFRWWRGARQHPKRTRRERETVKQLWYTIVIKITILHVQCDKNNFKQPFTSVGPLSLYGNRSFPYKRLSVKLHNPDWFQSLQVYMRFGMKRKNISSMFFVFKPRTWNLLHLDWNNLYRSRNDFVSKPDRWLIPHGHSSIQNVIDRNDRLICAVRNVLPCHGELEAGHLQFQMANHDERT